MQKKLIFNILPILMLLLIASSASAAYTAFSVSEPDGTADSTSAFYTVTWTGALAGDGPLSDINNQVTISCYGSGANTGYQQGETFVTGAKAVDENANRQYIGNWEGRGIPGGASYYIWCINDLNSDMNDYSSGQLTLVRFEARDMGGLAVDIPGALLAAFARNAGIIGAMIVILIIVVLLIDLLTGIFGIFNLLRNTFGNMRG